MFIKQAIASHMGDLQGKVDSSIISNLESQQSQIKSSNTSDPKLNGIISPPGQESERQRLQSISPDDLKSQGQSLKNSLDKESNLGISSNIVDGAVSKAKVYRADDPIFDSAKDIWKNPQSVIQSVKDCEHIGNDNAEVKWKKLKTKRKRVEKDIPVKAICEHLMNVYKCTETRNMKCTHKASAPFAHEKFSSGSLPKSYDPVSGILTFGWNHNFTQGGGVGTQHDYSIAFNIESIEALKEFILTEVGYDDYLRIEVNNTQIFNGPFGGNKLLLRQDKIIYSDGAPGYPFYGVQINDDANDVLCVDQFKWRHDSMYSDIKYLLRTGVNTIKVRLIVGGGGGLWLKFIAKINTCNSWQEEWEETCIHLE